MASRLWDNKYLILLSKADNLHRIKDAIKSLYQLLLANSLRASEILPFEWVAWQPDRLSFRCVFSFCVCFTVKLREVLGNISRWLVAGCLSSCLQTLRPSKHPGRQGLVVAAHRAAMDTLALSANPHGPTILSINPQPHHSVVDEFYDWILITH